MSLVRNAFAVSLLLTALAVLVLAVSAWLRRRVARGAAALALLSLAAAAWAACEALWLVADGSTAGAHWLQAARAVGVLLAPALLHYAFRATRLLGGVARWLTWAGAGLGLAAAALAFGPAGGVSLWRAFRAGTVHGRAVTLGVPSAWNAAVTALVAVMLAGALLVLAVAWLGRRGGAAAQHGWTLLGAAMPVVAEAVVALLPGHAAGAGGARLTGLSPGAFLLAPAALAAAQGLLGGGRALRPEEAADEPAPAPAGAAPRDLLDHLDQAVLMVGPDRAVSYANAAASRWFRPAEGLVGAQAATLFADLPQLAAALEARRRAVLELTLRRGGAEREVEVWLTPLVERTGRRGGTMLAFLDVSARRQAQREQALAAGELARSEALMEALQEALRGALRGQPVAVLLDVIATGVARALDVPNAALYLLEPADDALVRKVALGGFESRPEPALRRDEGLAGRAWASGRTEAADALPDRREDGGGGGDDPWSGTALAVPLRERGQVAGVLLVARRRGEWRPYSAGEVATLERFADLAAVAVRDAAARDLAVRTDSELAWLDRIDALIAEEAPDTEVLDAVLRAAGEAAGFDRAVVWLATEDGTELESRAWLGFPQGPEGGERWPVDGSAPLLEEVFRSGREIVLSDGGPLPARFRPAGAAATSPLLRLSRPAALPLAAGERALGVLTVDDRLEGVELEARLRTLRRVAARGAQALERGRLRSAAGCLRERAREAEARLEAASGQREALIEALPAAYFETDLSGTVTRATAELVRLAGADGAAGSLKGMRLADLAAAGDEQTVPELMGRVLRSGRSVRGAPWALRARGGDAVPVVLSLAVLRDGDGAPRGYFGMLVPRPA